MKFYIVNVIQNKETHTSQEGYKTLKEAQNFVLSRNDCPEKISPYLYMNNLKTYKILEIEVK